MIKIKRSASSGRWMQEHFSDKYVRHAHIKELRSRSWFKLDQIQQSERLFKPGMNIIDLGAAPGGWSEYAATQIGNTGRIIACDILLIDPIPGVEFLQGDLCDALVLQSLLECIGGREIQIVMSDMAPNMSGHPEIDVSRSVYLAKLALKVCRAVLKKGGSFLVKIFQGEGFDQYLREIRPLFLKVKIRKPKASRARSREVYIVAKRSYCSNRLEFIVP